MHRVPFDGSFSVEHASCEPPKGMPSGPKAKAALKPVKKRFSQLQRALYAADRHSLLLVFQAMDAAGKDSTIRAVTSGVNPAGFQVHSFKKPTATELEHDFLWRTTRALPERGRIGIFNRSHYEETLVVRVHPQLLEAQRLPDSPSDFWAQRFESIRSYESHLARNGTVIIKFWLNVSRQEQMRRFARRLEVPEKNWKFSARDLDESERWADYMRAYEDVLRETSRPHAPWYAIPADDKGYMRLAVARVITDTLEQLNPQYPAMPSDEQPLIPGYLERVYKTLDGLTGGKG